jgi:PepSY-associated TM region
MRAVKTWLFLWHRWLGLGGCLLIALWFASGFVMMYVPFPLLTEAERIERLPTVDIARVRVSAYDALATARARFGSDDTIASLKLVQPSGAPIYAVQSKRHGWLAVDASTGEVRTSSELNAVAAARRFSGLDVVGVERLDVDQWSVYPGLAPHRPLFAVDMVDGGRHYVSSRTGELLRDTSRFERGWNWLGSVVHWIYVTPVRSNSVLWHWAVVVTSIYAIVVALLGTVIGVLRLRVRGYASGRRSPYVGWMRWHHLLGLFGALFVFSWLVSGLLSMNPFDVFTKIDRADFQNRWRGASFATSSHGSFALPSLGELRDIKEIEWLPHAEGSTVLLTSPAPKVDDENSSAPRIQLEAVRAASDGARAIAVDAVTVRSKAGLLNAAPIASIERLDGYDLYYYGRRTAKPLPIWRVKFEDAAQTWWHVDGRSGELIGALNRSTRVERWLYYGMHSWDWLPLWNRRPWAWDVPMVAALLLGTAFSITSVVVAWRRLRGVRKPVPTNFSSIRE